ncbi:MAG: glycosyltransferase, partial [Actinomycetales bacterium]|nr:glycosyltransferase [Actinomycetales bacterium]
MHAVLDQLTSGSFELIVVVDGFLDNTVERATAIALPHTTVTGYATNVGKGHAVRYGMQLASGSYVGFIDAG